MAMAPDSRPKRRRFTAEYKARVLRELERVEGRGEASSLLREEGLYWSHVAKWRRQLEQGELEDSWTEPWVRARIQTLIEERAELMREIEQLERNNSRLKRRLGLEAESAGQAEA